MEVFFAVLGTAVVLSLLHRATRPDGFAKKIGKWRRLADELRLTFLQHGSDRRPALHGTISGRKVTIQLIDDPNRKNRFWTEVNVIPRIPLPPDLQVHHLVGTHTIAMLLGQQDITIGAQSLDRTLRFRGSDAEGTIQLFSDEGLREALRGLTTAEPSSAIAKGVVTLRAKGCLGKSLDELYRRGMRLAAALDRARRAPWAHIAKTHDLSLRQRKATLKLDGMVDEMQVSGMLTLDRCSIRVVTSIALPEGFFVRLPNEDKGERLITGDPILDRLLHIECLDSARGVDLVTDPAVRGPLLQVVHGFPQSRVFGNEVRLITGHLPAVPVSELFDHAVTLARTLRDHMRR